MSLAWGQIPQTISYQGVLKDNNDAIVTDGQYDLTFRLFDVDEFGTPLWIEDHTAEYGAAVTVTDGVFSVILGSITPLALNFDSQYWLEIVVGTTTLPRIPLTASPYSLASQSVTGGANIFPATGNVGIGTTSPSNELQVGGDVTIGLRTDDDGSTPGYGNYLYFSGGDDWSEWDRDNSDPI